MKNLPKQVALLREESEGSVPMLPAAASSLREDRGGASVSSGHVERPQVNGPKVGASMWCRDGGWQLVSKCVCVCVCVCKEPDVAVYS